MRIFCTVFFLFFFLVSQAQESRQDLEKARLEIIKNIEETQQQLIAARTNKESTLSKLNALEKQIDSRTQLIANLQKDQSLSEQTIETETVIHEEATNTSNLLVEDYNQLLRIRYRNKLLNRNASSLFNAERLHELITKWKYLKIYEKMLLAKGSEITKLDTQVDELRESIKTETVNHADLISKETIARDSLKLLMTKLTQLATNMTAEERAIRQRLEIQNQSRERFNQAIEKSIISSIGSTTISTTQPAVANSTNRTIMDRKGFLPWPLTDAKLKTRFGPQPHPTIAGIVVNNKGIDINSHSTDATVIYSGEVINVAEVKGSGMTVIVKHDNDIYSVYSNLETTVVQAQAYLNQGDLIGTAQKEQNGMAMIHFELYQGKQNLNPNHWLKNN